MPGRSVVLVCGPPCAGKSTLAASRGSPGDLVVDSDEIAVRLGSPARWLHEPVFQDAAEREFERLCDEIAAAREGYAWVIRCAPEAKVRDELARRLCTSRVLLLRPPLGVLLRRARARPDPGRAVQAVWRWLDRYEPRPGDEVLRQG